VVGQYSSCDHILDPHLTLMQFKTKSPYGTGPAQCFYMSFTVLVDSEIMGVAFEIFLQFCIQA